MCLQRCGWCSSSRYWSERLHGCSFAIQKISAGAFLGGLCCCLCEEVFFWGIKNLTNKTEELGDGGVEIWSICGWCWCCFSAAEPAEHPHTHTHTQWTVKACFHAGSMVECRLDGSSESLLAAHVDTFIWNPECNYYLDSGDRRRLCIYGLKTFLSDKWYHQGCIRWPWISLRCVRLCRISVLPLPSVPPCAGFSSSPLSPRHPTHRASCDISELWWL